MTPKSRRRSRRRKSSCSRKSGIFSKGDGRHPTRRDLTRRDAIMADTKERPRKIIADNRKARFNYEIGEVFEAGIALTGTEVKSLRNGRAHIGESYADKRAAAVEREGMTIVPLKLFLNEKGRAKIEIALGRGKKLHDKRETEKKRSWDRERGRLMRAKG